MIRRNHIDTNKVGRQSIRSRPQFNTYQPNPPNSHSTSIDLSENRMRLTSNHKKYYQYKEEREARTRPFQHQPQTSEKEERPVLADLSLNVEMREDTQLRREYTYEPEDTLKIDYNSISLKTNEQRRTTLIAHQAQPHNHHISAPSPISRKASPFPNSTGFTPLFQETTVAMKRRQLQESRCGLGRIYETSSNKTAKTEIEGRETGREVSRAHQRRQSTSDYPYMPSKSDPISQISLARQSPSLAGSLQKEEVSEKLRMISQFNDQINERIKNIIGCFQGLKNKL